MADELRVGFKQMAELRDVLSRASAGIVEALSRLDSETATMLGLWNGGAAEAFANVYHEWHSEMVVAGDHLLDASKLVDEAYETYVAAERQAAARWAS